MKTEKVNKLVRIDLKERLKDVLPEVFEDNKVNFEKLKSLLSGEIIEKEDDRFYFNWAGKNNLYKLIQAPAYGTLKPDKEKSVDFDNTKNIVIVGENLETLKLLLKPYFGKVKMIYIDPPYNTGKDFIYRDNFKEPLKDYLEKTGQVDSEGKKLTTNTEASGRYHSDWLNFIYPRLFLARSLLRDDGVIFISIDDHEIHHLRMIMDEIFGEENFRNSIIWGYRTGGSPQKNDVFAKKHDYLLFYSKSMSYSFNHLKEKNYYEKDFFGAKKDESGKFYAEVNLRDVVEGEIELLKDGKFYKKINVKPVLNLSSERVKNFLSQKPIGLIKFLMEIMTNQNDIILDFFAGSGTTGHAVWDLNKEDGGNRKFILVQLDEEVQDEEIKKEFPTVADICIERLKRVSEKYKKEIASPSARNDISSSNEQDFGFKVFKLDKSNFNLKDEFEIDPSEDKEELKKKYLEWLGIWIKEPLVSGWKEMDVIYEVMLKEGLNLNSKIEKIKIKDDEFYYIQDEEQDLDLYISLKDKFTSETIEEIRTSKYKGKMFVFLDKALTDSDKINLSAFVRLKVI